MFVLDDLNSSAICAYESHTVSFYCTETNRKSGVVLAWIKENPYLYGVNR